MNETSEIEGWETIPFGEGIGHGMLKAVMNQDVFMLFPIIARNGIENFQSRI